MPIRPPDTSPTVPPVMAHFFFPARPPINISLFSSVFSFALSVIESSVSHDVVESIMMLRRREARAWYGGIVVNDILYLPLFNSVRRSQNDCGPIIARL
jgi:hypothetical protein